MGILYWLVVSTYPSEKYELVKVSWDDEIPNWMESHKIHVPNHQSQYRILIGISCDVTR
jgi:hypothetical protein